MGSIMDFLNTPLDVIFWNIVKGVVLFWGIILAGAIIYNLCNGIYTAYARFDAWVGRTGARFRAYRGR